MPTNEVLMILSLKDEASAAAASASDKMAKSFDSVKLAATAVATAVTAVGATLAGLAKQTADFEDQLAKMSQQVGVNIESLSGLKLAADLGGASLDNLGTSLGRLSRNILDAASGTGEALDEFRALGIAVTDSSGKLRGMEDVLLEIADRFSDMEDGTQKTAQAMVLLGRSGTLLIPTLNAGSAGLKDMIELNRRLGLTITLDSARASEHFNDEITVLQGSLQGLTLTIGRELIPIFDPMIVRLRETVIAFREQVEQSPEVQQSLRDIAAAYVKMAEFAVQVGGIITVVTERMVNALLGLASIAGAAVGVIDKETRDAILALSRDGGVYEGLIKKMTEGLKDFNIETARLPAATDRATRGLRDTADAARELKQAMDAVQMDRLRHDIDLLEREALRTAIPRLAEFEEQIRRIDAAERERAARGLPDLTPSLDELEAGTDQLSKLADHLAIGQEASAKLADTYTAAMNEMRVATGRFAESAAQTLTTNFFDVVEGRFESFGQAITEILKDIGKQIFELGLTDLLRGAFGLQPIGGRGISSLFGLGAAATAAGAVGVPGTSFASATAFPTSGITPSPLAVTGQSVLQQATPLPPGLAGPGVPIVSLGDLSLFGAAAAGLGGAGIASTLFPGTGIGTQIGGGIGGLGGFIGGTAVASALSIPITSALSVAIPGVGAILGAVAGGFIGRLFGGGRRAQEQQEAQTRTAQGISVINSIINQPNVAQWQEEHPILANSLAGLVFHFNRQDSRIEFARHQSDFQIVLSELFGGGRLPSVQEYIRQMLRITTPADLAPGLGGTLNVAAIEAEEARRREEAARGLRLQEFGTQELPGVTAALFETGLAERGIAGVRELDPGLLAQIGVTTRIDRLDGVERLRITRRQVDAVDALSPEAVERLWQKVLDYLRRSGRPTGGLIEALQ